MNSLLGPEFKELFQNSPLILASQSPYRKNLLQRFSIPFQCHSPNCHEEELKKQYRGPLEKMAEFLALEKAKSLRDDFPQAIILAADQILICQNKIYSKPGSQKKAIEQLQELSGKEHQLITAFSLVSPTKSISQKECALIKFRNLSLSEIENYVAYDLPLDCAGSYKIESAGLFLMEKIECQDPTTIEGLPMIKVLESLRNLL